MRVFADSCFGSTTIKKHSNVGLSKKQPFFARENSIKDGFVELKASTHLLFNPDLDFVSPTELDRKMRCLQKRPFLSFALFINRLLGKQMFTNDND